MSPGDGPARRLRRLRERRGWSWADLARGLRDTATEVGVPPPSGGSIAGVRRTIARWERRTDGTTPGQRYRVLLLHLYARGPDGAPDLGPGSDFAEIVDVLREVGVPAARVAELVDLVAGQVAAGVLVDRPVTASTAGTDPAVLWSLGQALARIDEGIGTVPFVRLQLQLAPVLESSRRALRTGPQDEVIAMTAGACALGARLAFETGDDAASRAAHDEAVAVAGRLGDRSLRGAIRTSRAMMVMHAFGGPRAADGIARAAVADSHHGSRSIVRARAHAVYAEVRSGCGTAAEAAVALDRARRCIEQLSDDDRSGFTEARLDGFDGLCALHAGDLPRAEQGLGRARAALDASRDRIQRAIVGADLARTRLLRGEARDCVELLHESVDLIGATGGRVPMRRVRSVRRDLRPWRTEPFVADLDDHLHEVLLGR